MTNSSRFGADRPITAGQDKLGYAASASHVARAIARFASQDGFVLGLEGEWGSGKSSLVNLIIAALEEEEPRPEIIKFSPWLISSRDVLLDELFREIANAAAKIEIKDDDFQTQCLVPFLEEWRRKRRRNKSRRELVAKVRRFGGALSRLSAIANAGAGIIPGAATARDAFQNVGNAAANLASSSSLEGEKDGLVVELQKLSRKIIVFVDDLDRLEPAEAAEVVRLVRAAADFPNVVYVLCYSRAILARSLKKALKLENGAGYIDKIVQTTFSVPKPEDFDLRRMFREELDAIFPPTEIAAFSAETHGPQERLSLVVDLEGGRALDTPRDVIRVLNALRLYAGPIIDKIDLADMVWLQFVRVRNPRLYAWVETYINSMAAVSAGRTIREASANNQASELVDILGENGADVRLRLFELMNIIPGISLVPATQGTERIVAKLYDNIRSRDAFTSLIAEKRLGSPQHFRFYFALSKPSGAFDDSDYESFIATAARDSEAAAQSFVDFAKQKRPQGGSLVEGILSRLTGSTLNAVSEAALPALVLSLSDGMDVAASTSGAGDFGRFWIWDEGRRIFDSLLKRLTPEVRKEIIEHAFAHGKALGWLSNIMRLELFSHGRYGERERDPEKRILTSDELDLAISRLRTRFLSADPVVLLSTPHPFDLLFAWLQSGTPGETEVKEWMKELTTTDDGLLRAFECARGWASINGRVILPIKRENLARFTDFDALYARVEELTKSADSAIADRAIRILNAIRDGDEL